ncbi:MAG: hypothetical protein H7X83_11760 [Verrucomicrobia bacterium]|nr:hypothetical protein [Deltaproteobacteria bacterium]
MCKKRARHFTIIMLAVSLVMPCVAFSECLEYKIVDHGDSVEAVCVGTPLTSAEQSKLEQESELEQQKEQQKIEDKKDHSKTETIYRKIDKYDNRGAFIGSQPSKQ